MSSSSSSEEDHASLVVVDGDTAASGDGGGSAVNEAGEDGNFNDEHEADGNSYSGSSAASSTARSSSSSGGDESADAAAHDDDDDEPEESLGNRDSGSSVASSGSNSTSWGGSENFDDNETWDEEEWENSISRLRLNDENLTEFNAFHGCFFQPGMNSLSRSQMESLTAAMRENTHLQKLNLGYCLEEPDMILPFLQEVLPRHPSIRELDLASNDLTPAHAVITFKFLAKVDLSYNSIGDKGTKALMASASRCLEELDLSANGIGDEGFQAVGSALAEKNSPLASLDLSWNSSSSTGAEALAHGLKQNTRLLSLSLFGCFKENPDAIQSLVCDALPKHPSLIYLNLGDNNLKNVHAKWIAAMLMKNTCLEQILLHLNYFGNKGACSQARGLYKNASLKDLSLTDNSIGQKGYQAFIKAIRDSNFMLDELHLMWEEPSKQVRTVESLLLKNSNVKSKFEELKSKQQFISWGLWPQALELISQKPDYLYSMLKSANPMIVQEQQNSSKRIHCEAFGDVEIQ